ncbi:MAG: nucleic acid-binding protein [Thermoplasmatales archaeon]|nr:nucleic acid-binding protein [Thermoplasmatales archaeon]
MVLVLDTSALYSMEDLPEGCVCTPGVVRELEMHGDRRPGLWGDLLRVSDCTRKSLDAVNEAAKGSGDDARLSPTDASVIALAMDLGGTVLTDDYSIQNVCKILGIPYRTVGAEGIKKVFRWGYRCVGCGKRQKARMPECPVCGSEMVSGRRK